MKLRCPYCRTISEKVHAICPVCGKAMRVPSRLRHVPKRQPATLTPRTQPVSEAGFTPLALLGNKMATLVLILFVFAMLGAMLTGRAHRAFNKGRTLTHQEKAMRDLTILSIALDRFQTDCGRYPTDREGLLALINNPGESTWTGPYVTLIRADPWHTPYIYEKVDDAARLRSAGPDRKPGTADDLAAAPLPRSS